MTIDLDTLSARLLADTDTVTLTRDELHDAIARLRTAEGIVRDLAKDEPIQYSGGDDGYYECRFCEEGNSQYREFPIEHKIDCLHTRALEFTKANP